MDKTKYLDAEGLLYFWQRLKEKFVAAEKDKRLITTEEATKLSNLTEYELPTASSSTLGGIKVGSGLTMTGDVLSADAQEGTTDYSELDNQPQINGVTLDGNKTTADLGITIPSKISDLTDDSDFVTSSDVSDYDTEIKQYIADVNEGKKATYVYATKAKLDEDLAKDDFKAGLEEGDVFLIVATDEPDYWWTGEDTAELQSRTFDFDKIENSEIDEVLTK